MIPLPTHGGTVEMAQATENCLWKEGTEVAELWVSGYSRTTYPVSVVTQYPVQVPVWYRFAIDRFVLFE